MDLGTYDFPPIFVMRHYPSNLRSLGKLRGERRYKVPTEIYTLMENDEAHGYYELTDKYDPALEEVLAVWKRAYPDEG